MWPSEGSIANVRFSRGITRPLEALYYVSFSFKKLQYSANKPVSSQRPGAPEKRHAGYNK
jgi:hypothetical protein